MIENWFGIMGAALLDILCGLICFCTLTYWRPMWDLTFRAYMSTRRIKRRAWE